MSKPESGQPSKVPVQGSASSTEGNKKRKRDPKPKSSQHHSTKATTSISESTSKVIDKRDRASWVKKKEKAKERRKKLRKIENWAEYVPESINPSSVGSKADMTVTDTIFTTPSGHAVTSNNAGYILTQYLFAFNQDQISFVAQFEITLIPPDDLETRKWKRDPKNPHQPPPGALYSCVVTLPSGVRIPSAESVAPGFRSKILAKQNAMGMMVKALVEAGEIANDLAPTPTGDAIQVKMAKNKDMRDMVWFEKQGQLAGEIRSPDDSMPGTTLNDRWAAFKGGLRDQLPPQPVTKDGRIGHIDVATISSPDFWNTCLPFVSGITVYPTLITLETPDHQAECRIICMLTTRPIPEIQDVLNLDMSIPVTPGRKATKAIVRLQARPKISKLDDDQLQLALNFTRRSIREHMLHPYNAALSDCPWLILPMTKGYNALSHPKVKRKHFDWDQVRSSMSDVPIPFDMEHISSLTPSALSDIMYTIKSEFAQRECIVKVRSDLTVSSPHPDHPEHTVASHAALSDPQGTALKLQYPNQPVFQCTIAKPGRHGGYPAELAEDTQASSLLIPELGAQSSMPVSIYRATSILPTLLPRLNDILIAREMSDKLFNSTLTTPLALQAITAPISSLRPEENYERLELLGDTLLKLMVTVDMYIRPRDSKIEENKFQQSRHLILSNRGLQNAATGAGITPYIRYIRHRPRDWKPSGWTYEEAQGQREKSHPVGGKVSD